MKKYMHDVVSLSRAEHDELLAGDHELLTRLFACPHSWSLSGVTFHRVPMQLYREMEEFLRERRECV